MKFTGTVKAGRLCFAPQILEQRKKYIGRLKDDSHVEESLIVRRQSKSQKQLGAFWGLAMVIAVETLSDKGYDTSFLFNTPNPTGIEITKDLLCEYLYSVCPVFNEEGKRVTLSKMDTQQAAKFFDKIRNFMASQWGITIPEPNPLWREESKGVLTGANS